MFNKILTGNISSKVFFSIAMLDYRSVTDSGRMDKMVAAPLDKPPELVPNPPMNHSRGCRTLLTAQHPARRRKRKSRRSNEIIIALDQ